ncbi:SMI1/KNR4 family protein [Archangium violaceum]|uniref:hypothetical protein n=1 Tax=Archangium violaceum TaxID=83451 RepID=UPI0036DE5A43
MPSPKSLLLEEVSRDHFPYPPATPEEIAEFEQRVGWWLDPNLRAFYLRWSLPRCRMRAATAAGHGFDSVLSFSCAVATV